MCGILGITGAENIEGSIFSSALETLKHRGPDSINTYKNEKIFLGHTRLAILDLDDRANQPMESKCGEYILIYNGEIYNFEELREKYLTTYCFQTNSDTEVLLALLIKLGTKIIGELDGIFSFALYSLKDENMILARDRFGIKPLYYGYIKGEYICFASEIKAIRALTKFREINRRHIAEHILYGYVAGEHTLFDGVKRLLPGQVMEYDVELNEISTITKIDFPTYNSIDDGSTYELNKMLMETVRSQFRSDVPVGVMLSGGLDSSILSSICSLFSKDLDSFTISLATEKYDESVYAKELSRTCKLSYNELKYDYKDFDCLFGKLTYHHDEPLRHINSIPIYSITQMARDMGIKVLLAGEGADEIFGGYSVYLKIKIKIFASKVSKLIPKFVSNALLKGGYFTFLNKSIDLTNIEKYLTYSRASASLSMLKSITSLELDNSFRESITRNALRSHPKDQINAMMDVDQNIHLQSLLDRQDKMSMAASVECRVPFLNNNIAQLLNKKDSSLKISQGVTKKLLRKLSRAYLPKILVERKKHPFGLPLLEQLKSSKLFCKFVEDFEASLVFRNNFVNKEFKKLLLDFKRGNLKDSDLIYNVFSLEVWLDTFHNEN
ncbi:asparagine synthase (glutamine-hydrolyzing) [Akkermansiaceae bacterium]|nr:asparagine synthase (glutamine-hydrolyzing) [Akkermansiaceae bacterium]